MRSIDIGHTRVVARVLCLILTLFAHDLNSQRPARTSVARPNEALSFLDALAKKEWQTVLAYAAGVQAEIEQRAASAPQTMRRGISHEVYEWHIKRIKDEEQRHEVREFGKWVWYPHSAKLIERRRADGAFVHFIQIAYPSYDNSPVALYPSVPGGGDDKLGFVKSVTLRLSFNAESRHLTDFDVVRGSIVFWPASDAPRIVGVSWDHSMIPHFDFMVANMSTSTRIELTCEGKNVPIVQRGVSLFSLPDDMNLRAVDQLFSGGVNNLGCEAVLSRGNERMIDWVSLGALRGQKVCWVRGGVLAAGQWRDVCTLVYAGLRLQLGDRSDYLQPVR